MKEIIKNAFDKKLEYMKKEMEMIKYLDDLYEETYTVEHFDEFVLSDGRKLGDVIDELDNKYDYEGLVYYFVYGLYWVEFREELTDENFYYDGQTRRFGKLTSIVFSRYDTMNITYKKANKNVLTEMFETVLEMDLKLLEKVILDSKPIKKIQVYEPMTTFLTGGRILNKHVKKYFRKMMRKGKHNV